MCDERGFAHFIAHGMVRVGLGPGNLLRQARALAERVQEHLVQIVQ